MKKPNPHRLLAAAILLLAVASSCKKDPAPPMSCFRKDAGACSWVGLDSGSADLRSLLDGSKSELGDAFDTTGSSDTSIDTPTREAGVDTRLLVDVRPMDSDAIDAPAGTGGIDGSSAAGGTGGTAGSTGMAGSAGSTALDAATSLTDARSETRAEVSPDIRAGDAPADARDMGGDRAFDVQLVLDHADETDADSDDGPPEWLDGSPQFDTDTDQPPPADAAHDAPASDTGGLCIDAAATGCATPTAAYQATNVSLVAGVAADGTGNPVIAAKLAPPRPEGGAIPGPQILMAKLDPITLVPTWSKSFAGTTSDTEQVARGVAVSQSGAIGVIGEFTGNIVINATTTLTGGGSAINFVMGADGSGNGLWGKKVDTFNGSLKAIASHPSRDEFVLCGYAMAGMTDLELPGTYNGDGLEDVVIAKLGADGSVLWARQIGEAGTQTCGAVALGSDGVVYAAGVHNGTINFGDGALPVLGSSVQAVWVAKLASADGHGLLSRSFGTAGKQVTNGIAVDSLGNVAVAGNVRGSIPFGSHTVSSSGGTDAFVAKMDSSLVPQWATRWGNTADQTATSLSFNATNDVLVVGYIKGAATLGCTTLTSAGLSDVYWAKLAGSDGSPLCAAIYGNSGYDQAPSSMALAANKVLVAGSTNGTTSFNLTPSIAITGTSSSMTTGFVFVMP